MNSVYFPAPVVLILRRLANVISTLSISNQYLLTKPARSEELEGRAEDEKQSPSAEESAPSSWDTIRALREVEWPTRNTWEWPQFMISNGPHLAVDPSLKVPDLTVQCVFLHIPSDIQSDMHTPT